MIPTLSIIVPVFNEEKSLPFTSQELLSELSKMVKEKLIHHNSFLLFIDDGSNDFSWNILKKLHTSYANIFAIKLSKNFGHNNALYAGLMVASERSDISISIDCDLQQSPKLIPLFIEKYKLGADIVYGVRNDRSTDTFSKKVTAILFYKFMKLMRVNIIYNHADFRLLSSKVLKKLAHYNEPDIFLRGVLANIGFNKDYVYFDVKDRKHGSSKYTYFKMIKFALTAITSFTSFPLRMVTLIGFITLILSIIMIMYILIISVIYHRSVPGWASTLLPIYFIGGIQIFCIGIIGEYLSRVYETVKARPTYIIEEDLF
jgi:polyisoprenyl-phosphate glycosyltransferase